jgi:hypothetical protein
MMVPVEASGHLHCWPWAAMHHVLHLVDPMVKLHAEYLKFASFISLNLGHLQQKKHLFSTHFAIWVLYSRIGYL